MTANNLQYQWAAGHNNSGGLYYVHQTIPTGDFAFGLVTSIGYYVAGLDQGRMSGLRFKEGYENTKWREDFITRLQLKYMRDTFCFGDWSGFVTINTRLPNEVSGDEFAIYNATMVLKEPTNDQNQWIMDLGVPGYTDYIIEFVNMYPVS